jgi:hypothetical protein
VNQTGSGGIEPDIGLQQTGAGCEVRVFEGGAVAVEQLAKVGIVGLDHVVFGRRDVSRRQ